MNEYLLSNKKVLALYSVLAVITYFCLTSVYLGYSFITETAETKNLSQAKLITILCFIILAALLIFIIFLSTVKRKILYLITKALREDIFRKVFRLSYGKYTSENSSYYSSMIINDVESIEEDYFSNLIEMIGDSIQLIVMLVSIGFIGWKYLLIVMLFSVVSIVQPYMLKTILAKHGLYVSNAKQTYTEKVKEYIYSFETIKVFRKQPVIESLFNYTTNQLEAKRRNEDIVKTMNSILLIISVYLIKVGSTLFFAHSAIVGYISIATVATLFGLTNNVGNPISSILDYIKSMNSTLDVRKKILNFLHESEEIANGVELDKSISSIDIAGLKYSYDGDRMIIDDINLTFLQGKKYALIGESGSGKSTILKLLMQYYPDYNGLIMVNKKNMKEFNLSSIRNRIAYINQNVYLFEGTLRENIAMYDMNIRDDTILDAIEKTGLHDVFVKLSNGLDSLIKESGSNFSGGEKQRIALARAYVSGADVFLVDEGVAALDNITAQEVEKILLTMEGKMVISIIHRMNETVYLYDEIVELEYGKVKKKGTYKELTYSHEMKDEIAITKGEAYETSKK